MIEFNGWAVTQRIKKETKTGTSFKIKFEDRLKGHKLALEVDEKEYQDKKYEPKHEFPPSLVKGYDWSCAEKNTKETRTGTKLRLTFDDEDAGAVMKLEAGREDFDKYETDTPLLEDDIGSQQTLDNVAKLDKAEVIQRVNP